MSEVQVTPQILAFADRILAAVEADQAVEEKYRPKLGESLAALSAELIAQSKAADLTNPANPFPIPQGEKPVVAWQIEVAYNMTGGEYGDWRTIITDHKPDPTAPSIRNIRELTYKD